MITIKDIARELDLSYASISLALNDSHLIGEQTRLRVKQKALEMGYVPNASARALVLRKTKIVGFILPDIRNPFFADLSRGAEEVAKEHGYNLLICNTDWDLELESLHLRLVEERKIDGILIASSNAKNPILERILSKNLPMVFVSSSYPHATAPFIGADSVRGGYLAGRHLIELGHTNLAVVGGRFNSESVTRRYEGFRSAVRESRDARITSVVYEGDFTVDSGYSSGKTLLKRSPEVTGIFAFNDLVAVGLLKALREAGVSVPGDVSIVGFDDIFISALPGIELTTIHQEKLLMGRRAMEVLLEQLEQGHSATSSADFEGESSSFAPTLVIRNTTGPAPQNR